MGTLGQMALAASGAALGALDEGAVQLTLQGADHVPTGGVAQLHPLTRRPDGFRLIHQRQQHGDVAVQEGLFLVQ